MNVIGTDPTRRTDLTADTVPGASLESDDVPATHPPWARRGSRSKMIAMADAVDMAADRDGCKTSNLVLHDCHLLLESLSILKHYDANATDFTHSCMSRSYGHLSRM